MSSCCDTEKQKIKIDFILWFSFVLVFSFYSLNLLDFDSLLEYEIFKIISHSVYELMNKMWIGIALGIFFVSLLSTIPREFIIKVLGKGGTFKGVLRATIAGILLDLCSHGILMVGAKLYERGASIGQLMAFLIASPWNSLSLTVILVTLIGIEWTILFIILSILVAVISGLIFEALVKNKVLSPNPNSLEIDENFNFWQEAKTRFSQKKYNLSFFKDMIFSGLSGSKIIIKWLLFGVLLASLIRAFVDQNLFQEYFGPSLIGLFFTIAAATIIEVCSEGSAPIASDIINRADAPGNGFAFLMAGVSTDYTEIMVLKETTRSWKISLFLPLITLPQIVILGAIINGIHN